MSDDQRATFTLNVKQRAGIKRPVVHVLTPDGRVTEFRDRAIVVPAAGAREPMFALLIVNRTGEPYVTPDGNLAMIEVPTRDTPEGKRPVVVEIPVIGLEQLPDPDRLLDWKQMAQRAGVPLGTAKHMVRRSELPKPQKRRDGGRKVGVRQGDVDAAVAKLKGGTGPE